MSESTNEQKKEEMLNDIEKNLIDSTNKLSNICDTLRNYDKNTQKEKLNNLIQDVFVAFKNIFDICNEQNSESEITIPVEVLNDLDSGIKPDAYGKKCVEEFRSNHQKERVRLEGLNTLYNYLCEEIRNTMDKDVAESIINLSKE